MNSLQLHSLAKRIALIHGPWQGMSHEHAIERIAEEIASALQADGLALKYTNEKPTVPGWYWWRHGGTEEVIKLGESGVVLVAGYEVPDDIEDMGGEFMGPLVPPEEP